MSYDVVRPGGLDEPHWNAISRHLDRLRRAMEHHDYSLAVGTAKELLETVAKVVLELRGEVVASSADMSEVVNRAHATLERQPGRGLASDPTIRRISQSLKALALEVNDIRNRIGTGHGRATSPEIVDEHVSVCLDAAIVWVRWTLRRLELMISGLPGMLASDLLGGELFRSGTLTERLTNARLSELEEADQRMLGAAVGHRAASGTFVVLEDGVEACASDSSGGWPPGYRAGLLESIFLDRNGYLGPTPRLAGLAASVVAGHPDAATLLSELVMKAENCELAYSIRDVSVQEGIVRKMCDASPLIPDGSARSSWLRLAELIAAGEEGA